MAHKAGTVNDLPLTTFHEVTKVLVPGRTLSMMNCERGKKEGWGYLDLETGQYTPNKQSAIDKRFGPMILDRNPHLRNRK